jgi:hypothetical protein
VYRSSGQRCAHLVHACLLVVGARLGFEMRCRHEQWPVRKLIVQQCSHKALCSRLPVQRFKAVSCTWHSAVGQCELSSVLLMTVPMLLLLLLLLLFSAVPSNAFLPHVRRKQVA